MISGSQIMASSVNNKKMKLLVAIASHGHSNDRYLEQLIHEYRSMKFDIDIVVLSNLNKQVGSGVEVVVGVPTKDPWSLPFAHKRIFAERVNDYDLFVYSEDDILVTQENIDAFLRACSVLPETEIPGFLRIEKAPDGTTYYPEVHHRFHWDPASVRRRGEFAFAFFTNEHAACYMLTRAQLCRVLDSGGFLVGPHQESYDLLCTAATDPYTQCGLKKVICISQLDQFTVHHLPNKYLDRMGTSSAEVKRQIDVLLSMSESRKVARSLFETSPSSLVLPYSTYYCKNYYEPVQTEIIPLVGDVHSVLSIGCGWGAMEEALSKKGLKVVAVPLDPVIGACAKARGIEVIDCDLDGLVYVLERHRFDCILLLNVLHLTKDPVALLSSFSDCLSDDMKVIALSPNVAQLPATWKRIWAGEKIARFNGYKEHGMHFTSHQVIRDWFQSAGLTIEEVVNILPDSARKAAGIAHGVIDPLLASQLIAVARRTRVGGTHKVMRRQEKARARNESVYGC